MPMIVSVPLTLVPLAVYNIIAFGVLGAFPGDPWTAPIFTAELVSGARFTLIIGDLMIIAALVLLFVEILKATRTGVVAMVDHILSVLVFVAYLVEFLSVPEAAHSVFFILTVIALIDVVAGFSITIAGARRDIAFGQGDPRL